MDINERESIKPHILGLGPACALIALISFAAFSVYRIAIGVFLSEEFYLILKLIELALASFIPVLSGVALFYRLSCEGIPKGLLSALMLSLPKALYFAPILYFYFLNQGFYTDEALVFVFVLSIANIVVAAALSFIYALIARFIYNKYENAVSSEGLLFRGKPFDFSAPVTFSCLVISFLSFLVRVIYEFKDTVTYLIENADSYRMDEVFYILSRYLVIIAMLLVSHIIMHYLKRAVCLKKPSNDSEAL